MIWIDELGKAAKRLLRAPSYTAFTLTCLGLGVGSTAAVFAVVDAFLLRPLPFEAPDRLLAVWKTFSYDGAEDLRYFLKPPDFVHARDQARGSSLAAYLPGDVDVLGEGEPERLRGAKVTGNLFGLLGLGPLAGRVLVAEDERLENPVAMVGEGWAVRRFGSATAALGRALRIDGRPCEVVGVLPTRLAFPDDTEIWVPLTPREYAGKLGWNVVARLSPGVEEGSARDEVRRLGRQLRELDPSLNANAGLDAEALQVALTGSVRPSLLALLAAGLGLLLIASANVACLGLARARRRGREVGLRTTFGASRRRLVGESMAECFLVWLASATLGLLLATLLVPTLVALSPVEVLSFAPVGISVRVAALTAVVAAVAVLVATALPALRLALTDPAAVVRGVAGAGSRTTGARRGMSALIVADVAVTTVLLVGAGLMIRTAERLVTVDPGFDDGGVATLGVSAPPGWSESHPRRVAFFDRLLADAAALPGVEATAAAHYLPMASPEFHWSYNAEDHPPEDPESTEMVLFRVVTPGYFATLGVPLLEGRDVRPGDDPATPGVVVVSESMARRTWPGRSALGRRVKGGPFASEGKWWEVIGVVADVREQGVAKPPAPAVFFPLAQWEREYTVTMRLVVRSAAGTPDPVPALQARLRAWAPEAIVFEVEPLHELVVRSQKTQRFLMVLLVLAAGLALVQAAAGLYGVMAYDVHSQVRELGVRIALGASPGQVRRRVLAIAAGRAGLGLAVGGLAAALSTRLLGTLLADLSPADPATYLTVATVVGVMVLVATHVPARRATRTDPATVLRPS